MVPAGLVIRNANSQEEPERNLAMTSHISKSQMERYRERQLRGEELVSVNRHLGNCGECRSEYNKSPLMIRLMCCTQCCTHIGSQIPLVQRSPRLQPRFGKLSLALAIALVVVVGLTVALILRSSRSRNQGAPGRNWSAEIKGVLPSPPSFA